MFKTFLLVFALTIPFASVSYAQLGVGMKLGVPATDALDVFPLPNFSPVAAEQRPFVFGPYAELRFGSLGIELDALYRSYTFRDQSASESAHAWEFPVLIKKRFGSQIVKPFLGGGAAFRKFSDIGLATLKNTNNYGAVMGGGLELNLALIRLAPEVRYTVWGMRHFDDIVRSDRNEVTVLFSIGF